MSVLSDQFNLGLGQNAPPTSHPQQVPLRPELRGLHPEEAVPPLQGAPGPGLLKCCNITEIYSPHGGCIETITLQLTGPQQQTCMQCLTSQNLVKHPRSE